MTQFKFNEQASKFITEFIVQEHLPSAFGVTVSQYYGHVVQRIADLVRQGNRVPIVGINGAQGTGKSTFSACIAGLLQQQGLRPMILSIDDLYHTRQTRLQLSKTVHPLLKTRGVPGTHDMALGQQLFRKARGEVEAPALDIPRFDKSTDDRFAAGAPFPADGVDVVLFEGWCVGARPQPDAALLSPCNALERAHDKHAVWRTFVNNALQGIYAEVFSTLDYLIMLKPPGFDAVYRWRGEQEEKLRQKLAEKNVEKSRLMDEAALSFFISHYERLTRWMLEEMPARADEIFFIGDDHQVFKHRLNDHHTTVSQRSR